MNDKYKSITIMVVEDDVPSRELIVSCLKKMGITNIMEATNGQSAVSKLYLNKVQLIISDWRMPEMNGLEFFKVAQKENLIDDVPFMMISAENEKDKVIEALKDGVREYMVKPLDLELFKNKVEKLLGLQT